MTKNWLRFILSTMMVFVSITFNFAQEQKPYSLKEALRMARINNPVLQSERLNIDMAKTDVVAAKIRPNLTFNHETIQMTNSADFENSAGWYRGGNREELWEISKPLQIAGQRKHKIDYANKSLELEEHNYFET